MTNCILLFFHTWTFYKKSSNDQTMISEDFFFINICDFTWNMLGKIGSDDQCIVFIQNLLYVANK